MARADGRRQSRRLVQLRPARQRQAAERHAYRAGTAASGHWFDLSRAARRDGWVHAAGDRFRADVDAWVVGAGWHAAGDVDVCPRRGVARRHASAGTRTWRTRLSLLWFAAIADKARRPGRSFRHATEATPRYCDARGDDRLDLSASRRLTRRMRRRYVRRNTGPREGRRAHQSGS